MKKLKSFRLPLLALALLLVAGLVFVSSSRTLSSVNEEEIKTLHSELDAMNQKLAAIEAEKSEVSSDPFIGQIIQFGGNFAPRGWALCDGQLLSINSYSALFSILGTTYGGDGRTTFGLPDMRGRVAIHPGSGPGLSEYRLGARGGAEELYPMLNTTNVQAAPYLSSTSVKTNPVNAVGSIGQIRPLSNLQPYTSVNYIIALEGTYPSRN